MNKYTCVIVDDEIRVASHLEHMVRDFTDLEVLWVDTNPERVVRHICRLKPDIVFIDVEMPKKSGFEVIEEVRKHKFFPEFIFVTGYDHYAIRAVKESAFDYILKPVDIDELKECIARHVKKREIIVSGSDIDLPLNPREKEVLALIVQGLTSKQIAEKLSISKSTVETHRKNIREKTGAKSTAELIRLVLR